MLAGAGAPFACRRDARIVVLTRRQQTHAALVGGGESETFSTLTSRKVVISSLPLSLEESGQYRLPCNFGSYQGSYQGCSEELDGIAREAAEAKARNEWRQMGARSEHEALGIFMHDVHRR